MLRRLALLLAALAALASCGGGTSTADPFEPTRLLVFGDETSVIDDVDANANGRKYTVNALDADNVTVQCSVNPLWTQVLSDSFGLPFPQCNPSGAASTPGTIYAALDARVADVATQIDTHLAGGTGFGAKDLAVILAGMHDIVDLYAQYPTVGADALVAQAEARGAALADQAIRISAAGGRVLISTVPDIGLSPYAIAQEAAFPGEGRQALIKRLVDRFNAKMRTTLPPDGGRTIGLVLANEMIQSIVKVPTGFTNVIAGACDVAAQPDLRFCTTATLVTDGSATTWLWADDLRLSPAAHSRLGTIAVTQARRNPF